MDHEAKSDQDCVRRVQSGETDAFEPLVRRHEKKIFNLLYRWLGDYDEAAEAAQEVFLSAYRSLKKFRGDSSFSTWLYRIAVNHAKDRRKNLKIAWKRMVPLETADPDGDGGPVAKISHPGPDPAQDAEQQEVHERVQQALSRLDADDALLILLRDLQDASYEEIVQVLAIPIGTVKSRLHRARQALRTILAPYFYSTKVQK
jgi:RNA polymerase sigma-70 factor (ECF subfamily)